MRISIIAPLFLAALGLAACGDDQPRACKAPPDAKARAVAPSSVPSGAYADPGQPANGQTAGGTGYNFQEAKSASEDAKACVKRQAWALAKSRDSTELVADAAVTACDELIARSAQAEAANYGGDFQKPYDLDVKAMGRWARLYVIQYRSGQCGD
jgi:hypothetical protein